MKDFPAQYNLKEEDVFYFCHIPKTAGMTFRTIVEDYFDCKDICPATLTAQVADISPEALQTYKLFRGHLAFVDLHSLLPNKNFVNVTVLREPVSRVISHYEYIRRTPGDPHYAAVKNMTLEEYTTKMTAGRVGKNIQTYYLAKTAKFDIERVPPDEAFEIAKESLKKFAYVGLLERFQDSLFLLSYIFGWKPILNSRKENAAKSKTPREQLPAGTLEVIQEHSQLDIQIYEYAKEIFNERFTDMTQNLLSRYASPSDDSLVLNAIATSAEPPAEPLPFETLRHLLENHYEQRYLEQQVPVADAVCYDFCEPLKGTGWHRRECPRDGLAYRWMGPGTVSTLDLPVTTTGDRIVEFRVICTWVTGADVLDGLTLEVNGHPIELGVLHSDLGERILRGKLSQTLLDTGKVFTEFKFQIDRVISLKDANPLGNDARLVGLAINSVNVFPVGQEREKSILAHLFNNGPWQDVASFIKNNLKPQEQVLAPLAFSMAVPNPVEDYSAIFNGKMDFDWVVLHKGMMDKISSILLKLILRRFTPVFANEVFVVFSNRQDLPRLSYLSAHVRSVYVDRLKFYLEKRVKPIYARYFARRASIKQQKERQAVKQRLKKSK
ncbi:sulfotransferase family 2 domain-containing protein [Oculatella sp. LEGE 06141]|uniref:sulfotransferase family 2 domain-containing protein n=1 Tax=Oculatella sp. LEGE 06141 TaxID=1828648 RepID=UPI001881B2EF|nr:sulfotransferase family 2 domain-containing protein [Oculatella sp. LEGE 06141]MBE9177867.1 sulfotransferase family 2 domain-containing protein [Oculatella sp. LEGE 06141]